MNELTKHDLRERLRVVLVRVEAFILDEIEEAGGIPESLIERLEARLEDMKKMRARSEDDD